MEGVSRSKRIDIAVKHFYNNNLGDNTVSLNSGRLSWEKAGIIG